MLGTDNGQNSWYSKVASRISQTYEAAHEQSHGPIFKPKWPNQQPRGSHAPK